MSHYVQATKKPFRVSLKLFGGKYSLHLKCYSVYIISNKYIAEISTNKESEI
jgi:hypothetical protein